MIKMIKTLCVGVFLLVATDSWAVGSLAIDSNQGDQWGFSYNHATVSDAEQRALRECGSGCRIVKTFSNECAAFAADQAYGSTAYGWATASSRGQAQQSAMNYCSKQGGTQCQVRVWACDSN